MRYRFDQFELDTGRYELRVDGVAQRVEPLVFDLIAFLAANPGRIIGRDEIVDQVWKGRAVSDATISSGIKSARRALGDGGDAPGYIRTVRGRGFEFTGAVTADADEPLGPGPGGVVASAATASARTSESAARPVVAVMPLTNLSAEIDGYFADGLTEDVITNLARFRDLSVIGSSSTVQIKALGLEPRQVC